jgi:hypothetical protein
MAIRDLEASLAKLCSAHSKLLLPCLSSSGTATKILSSTAKGGLSAASLVLLTAVLKVCWCVLSGVCPPLPVPALAISDFAASAQESVTPVDAIAANAVSQGVESAGDEV